MRAQSQAQSSQGERFWELILLSGLVLHVSGSWAKGEVFDHRLDQNELEPVTCVQIRWALRRHPSFPCFEVSLALLHPDPILPQIGEVPLVGNQVSGQDVTHGEAASRRGPVPESMSYFRLSEEVLLPGHYNVDTSPFPSTAPPYPGVGLWVQETGLPLL